MKARRGSVLVIVLAALMLTAIAGAGLLLVAGKETATAHVARDVFRVRTAAEAAVRATIAAWDRSVLPVLGPAAPVPMPAGLFSVGPIATRSTAERIGTALWLVRGEAMLQPSGAPNAIARAAAAALVISLAPELPWSAFPATLASASDVSLAPSSVVDGSGAATPSPPWTSAQCPAAAAAAGQTLFGSAARIGISIGPGATLSGTPSTLAGSPPIQPAAAHADSASIDWLGPLRFDEAMLAADRFETGTVTPSPTASATCDTSAPSNWGAPLDPAHPCHDFFPLIAAAGPLSVGPGAGQGILLVDGDLTLAAGATFYGAILVRGQLRSHGAVVHGAVRALSVASPIDIRIHASDCALWRAFGRSPALRKAWRPPGRWWLPASGL